MEKVLGIVATNYPFGFGEPFLHEEVLVLSRHFDKILIILPEAGKIDLSNQLFELPHNVFVVPVYNKYSVFHKITSFERMGIRILYTLVKTVKKEFGLPVSLPIIKTFMAYEAREYSFRKRLLKELSRQSVSHRGLVLYSYWFTEYTYAIYKIKKQVPATKAYTRAHGWDLYFERHDPPYLPFRKIIIPALDKTLLISQHGLEYIRAKLNFPKEYFEVYRLGVASAARNHTQPAENALRIVSISFISAVKNMELLIRSLASVSEVAVHWHHIGGGEGSYGKRIHEMAEKMLSDKKNVTFRFTGNLTRQEIDEFLATTETDLLLNTSHSEGLPVSIMEAMSHGIPAIAPAVGGIPEIVHNGINGYLLPEKPQENDVKQALLTYHHLGAEQKAEMKSAAYLEWDQHYNSEKNYSRLADTLLHGMENSYRACTRCILDNQDYSEMRFDADGVCEICHVYDDLYRRTVHHGASGAAKLEKMLQEIKTGGKGKEYDCLIGVSGGVDSTYLAYLCKQWGLRPLVLHVDNGWNAELAVSNIENIVRKLGFELYTHVVNWNEMRDLQLAFLRASVVDIDVPTDNTYIASTYKIARKFGIRYILTGHNTVTEGWLPPNFNHYKYDLINIKAIHKKFGSIPVRTIPLISRFGLWYNRKIKEIKTYEPLNLINYNKDEVKETIRRELGWRDYGNKHFENIFTRFYQGYILPEKFHIDKRKAHLSTLICSGQITREEALAAMQKPSYDEALYRDDREFFIKKMGLTETEFQQIMQQAPIPHTTYPSEINIIRKLRPLARLLRKAGLRK